MKGWKLRQFVVLPVRLAQIDESLGGTNGYATAP